MFLPFAVFQSAWSSVQERKPAVLTWWVQGRLSCGEQGQCVWPEKVSCASFQVQFVIALSQCLSASTIRSTSISHLVLSSPFYNSFFVNVAVCLLPSCFLFLQSFSLLPQCLCFAQFLSSLSCSSSAKVIRSDEHCLLSFVQLLLLYVNLPLAL